MTFYTHETRVARKAHRCNDCHREISPGETYVRGFAASDTVWNWKECEHCRAVLRLYDLAWDGEYSDDDFVEWASDTSVRGRSIAELRHQAGYRMKWRTRSGKLLPVPKLAT